MTKQKYLISIIVPVYNGETTIRLAINSLLNQTYTNWECLVINDGSIDNTRGILDSFSDRRIRIYNFPSNKGRPYARQFGLNHAKGKYLAMLDADDFYAPNKLEEQIKVFEKNNDIVLVATEIASFGCGYDILTVRGGRAKAINKVTRRLYQSPVPHATVMIDMDIAKKYNYNLHLTTGQDSDFLTRILEGRSYYVIDEVLYYYSEFNSVSKNKIIKSKYLYLFWYINDVGFSFKTFTIIVSTFVKIMFLFILPIKYILKRRGRKATTYEIDAFRDVLRKINN